MSIKFGVTLSAAVVILLLCVPFLHAGETYNPGDKEPVLTFGAGMRLRYEFQNNFNQKYYGNDPAEGTANDGFLLGRFRAGLDWNPTDKLHIALWGQHAVNWDANLPDSAFYSGTFRTDNNPNKDYWELYTTYIELKDLFDAGLSITAGRQLITYGNCRIFGPGEWGNTGRWIWDAVKVSWQFDRGFMDVFYGQTMLHEVRRFSLKHRHGFAGAGFYGHVELVRTPFLIALEPTAFTKYDGHNNYTGEKKAYTRRPDGARVWFKKTGDIDSWYAGGRLYGQNIYGFDFDCTFLQEQDDFARDDLSACGYHVMVGYHLKVPGKPFFTLEYSYASGDSNPEDGDHETFQGAFGARDKMYGRMNLFHWRNLRDIEASVGLQPLKGLKVKISYHKFLLAERKDAWYLNSKAYRDPSGQSGDDVGREFDIVATWNLSRRHTVLAGFGHFRPDAFAEATASSKNANWFFLQWEYMFTVPLL